MAFDGYPAAAGTEATGTMRAFTRFLVDESGATTIEYGLIAGMVACVLITVLRGSGTKIGNKFNTISNALS